MRFDTVHFFSSLLRIVSAVLHPEGFQEHVPDGAEKREQRDQADMLRPVRIVKEQDEPQERGDDDHPQVYESESFFYGSDSVYEQRGEIEDDEQNSQNIREYSKNPSVGAKQGVEIGKHAVQPTPKGLPGVQIADFALYL
jgi:hypothetical protein